MKGGSMAVKKKSSAPAKQKVISSETPDGRAKLALLPEVNGAIVIDAFCKTLGAQSVQELMNPLNENIEAVQGGNLAGAEAMLMSQAITLQTIFTELSRRAALNMGKYLGPMETYLRLALKAQSQCTRTLEVLAAIKNPPVVFAKQANIAHGHQQINNASSHTRENVIQQNELLGDHHAEMDTRTTPAASLANPQLETVAALDGCEND
jgi:hypothetical protein